jgi:hypothetical protein
VADSELEQAERNAIHHLRSFAEERPDGPLVFVRVRAPEQIAASVGTHDRLARDGDRVDMTGDRHDSVHENALLNRNGSFFPARRHSSPGMGPPG